MIAMVLTRAARQLRRLLLRLALNLRLGRFSRLALSLALGNQPRKVGMEERRKREMRRSVSAQGLEKRRHEPFHEP
jgi:hypothetical protein